MPVVKLEVLRLDTHPRNDLFIIFSISHKSSALLLLLYHLNLLGSVWVCVYNHFIMIFHILDIPISICLLCSYTQSYCGPHYLSTTLLDLLFIFINKGLGWWTVRVYKQLPLSWKHAGRLQKLLMLKIGKASF